MPAGAHYVRPVDPAVLRMLWPLPVEVPWQLLSDAAKRKERCAQQKSWPNSHADAPQLPIRVCVRIHIAVLQRKGVLGEVRDVVAAVRVLAARQQVAAVAARVPALLAAELAAM